MTTFRLSVIMAVLCVISSVGILFAIKTKVQALNKDLIRIDKIIAQEEEETHILRAEFAHLSRLPRMEKLVVQYLPLQVLKPEQTINTNEYAVAVAFNEDGN